MLCIRDFQVKQNLNKDLAEFSISIILRVYSDWPTDFSIHVHWTWQAIPLEFVCEDFCLSLWPRPTILPQNGDIHQLWKGWEWCSFQSVTQASSDKNIRVVPRGVKLLTLLVQMLYHWAGLCSSTEVAPRCLRRLTFVFGQLEKPTFY